MAASAFSASSCTVASSSTTRLFFIKYQIEQKKKQSFNHWRIGAASDDPDCNTEECAPDKEVGKVSVEWLAGEKTKVVGTFPPRKRGWTGYVEKDTAGQTNIYSVEMEKAEGNSSRLSELEVKYKLCLSLSPKLV